MSADVGKLVPIQSVELWTSRVFLFGLDGAASSRPSDPEPVLNDYDLTIIGFVQIGWVVVPPWTNPYLPLSTITGVTLAINKVSYRQGAPPYSCSPL